MSALIRSIVAVVLVAIAIALASPDASSGDHTCTPVNISLCGYAPTVAQAQYPTSAKTIPNGDCDPTDCCHIQSCMPLFLPALESLASPSSFFIRSTVSGQIPAGIAASTLERPPRAIASA